MSPDQLPPSDSAVHSTPQITINKDLTDLDSANAFEGPEKLLEVWFAPSEDELPEGAKPIGLKSVSPGVWSEMLELVNCKVLSIVESDHVDAYLLSESSMFIWPHKLILKTCGTTTLLLGLRRMFEIAANEAGFPALDAQAEQALEAAATPYRVFYSRKKFLFPQRQQGPHRSWQDEVRYLDTMFSRGSAYLVGKMNGDHWYLYITEPNLSMMTPTKASVQTGTELQPKRESHDTNGSRKVEDETLEILMTDLEPEKAKRFYLENARTCAGQQRAREEALSHLGDLSMTSMEASRSSHSTAQSNGSDTIFSVTSSASTNTLAGSDEDLESITEGHALGTVVSQTCGLSDVYPTSKYANAKVDAYLFNPCGFSANGVIPPRDVESCSSTHYFTVHVTPEADCSYASFETNVPGCQTGRETIDVIRDVVSIFAPGRFSVTLFEAKASGDDETHGHDAQVDVTVGGGGGAILRSAQMERIPGYRRTDRIVHEFDGYDLVFRYYEREGWQGGGARVGKQDL